MEPTPETTTPTLGTATIIPETAIMTTISSTRGTTTAASTTNVTATLSLRDDRSPPFQPGSVVH